MTMMDTQRQVRSRPGTGHLSSIARFARDVAPAGGAR